MSYNTRRTTGGAGGRPSPSTQVNYHQQPNRAAAGNTAQQNRNANVGYSTTQQPAAFNSAAQPAYSTPAYTTTPPLPPAQPKTAAPAQQQQAPPPPPSTPAAKPPVTPATTPAPVFKQEPVTPADTPKATDTTENGETAAAAKERFWKKRPFVKVSNKVRRARQNAKLRRILNPKNALTFLNELRPGTGKFVVREDPGWGYTATVEVDGKTFTGHGLGASKAKVQASERALKYLLLEQLSKSQQAVVETKEEPKEEETMDTTEQQEGEEPKAKKQRVLPEDDVPWGSLAAFALHKLFMEWQKEGPVEAPLAPQQTFPVEKYDEDVGEEEQYFTRRPPVPPEFGYRGRGFPRYPNRGRGYAPYRPAPPGFGLPHPGRRPLPPSIPVSALFDTPLRPQQQAPVSAAPMKKIPEDANQRHPVMLLNQLRPNVIYNESREGEQPLVTFVITIDIDGQQYVGRGKNKKEAKKQAAKAALVPMGIIYNEPDSASLNY